MLSRVLVAALGVPLVYALCVGHELSRLALLVLVSVLGQIEFDAMARGEVVVRADGTNDRVIVEPGAISAAAVVLGVVILGAAQFAGERGLLLAMGAIPAVLGVREVLAGLQGSSYRRYFRDSVNLMYLPFCLAFWVLLARAATMAGSNGGQVLFALLASVWALDSGAYFVGMALRGPALAPAISPKKTISGSVGGIVSCGLAIYGLVRLGWLPFAGTEMVILAVLLGTLGQLADLFESLLKRRFGIKDSGTLLAGHGGMLDRLDSLVLVAPFCYAFWLWHVAG